MLTAKPPALRMVHAATRLLLPPPIVTAVPWQASITKPRHTTCDTSFMVTRLGMSDTITRPVSMGDGGHR